MARKSFENGIPPPAYSAPMATPRARQPWQRTSEWEAWLTTTTEAGETKRTPFGRWYAEMARGSRLTANENARVLARLCRHMHVHPDDIVKRARDDPQDFADTVADFIDDQTDERKEERITTGTARRYLVTLQGWLRFNGVQLARKPKLHGAEIAPTLVDEQVPSQVEVRRALALATPRGRASISLMYFTGVRPGSIGSETGQDGLRLADLPDLDITGEPKFTTLPARVQVRGAISKTKRPYLTFLAGEGAEHVLTYLRQRIAAGERLGPSSPVVRNENENGGHCWTQYISDEIRRAFDAAGISSRPYVLRAAFSTACLMAENRQGMPHAFSQHMAGHVGDMDARYSTSKKLPPELIEDLRKRYRDMSAAFLSTGEHSLDDGPSSRLAEMEEKLARQGEELRAAKESATVPPEQVEAMKRLIAEEIRKAMGSS